MKKLIWSIPIIFSLSKLVSARPLDFEFVRHTFIGAIDSLLKLLAPFFELIIGDYSTSEFFLAKVLLLILLTIVCKYALDKTPLGENGGKASFFIAIIVSILSIRFINESDLIGGILIPYGALGVAVTTIIPLVIFFYFTHKTNVGSFGRKIFWSIFIITMGVLWISKFDKIDEISNWIYILTLIASILLVIFDRSIHSYLGFSEFKKYQEEDTRRRVRELGRELRELNKDWGEGGVSESDYLREKKSLERRIRALTRE